MAPYVLLLAALATFGASGRHDPPRFHVLLVGIGPYPGGRFGPLRGDQDMARLADVLKSRWNVPEAAIRLLATPAETTKRAILDAFREQLIDPAKPGDVVYFAYAGHGTQVPDASKPTGLSQAIVPIDVRVVARDGNSGSRAGDVDADSVITGPEIGRLLDALRAKGVANVTLTFDCCHSGSLTRGACRARGVANPAAERVIAARGSRGGAADPGRLLDAPALRGTVCISAARADQSAFEDARGGFLSQALIRALSVDRPAQTYGALFRDIQTWMAYSPIPVEQDPQLEGPADRVLFADTYSAAPPTVPVYLGEEGLVMRAGASTGIQNGFVVGLYPPGTTSPNGKPSWTAVVQRADATRSLLRLDAEAVGSLERGLVELNGAVAVVLDGRSEGRLRLNARALRTDPRGEPMLTALRGLSVVELTDADDYDLLLARAGAGSEWRLETPAGKPVATVPNGEGALLEQSLRTQARKLAVARLGPSEAPRVALEMRLVRVAMDHGRVSEIGEELPPRTELGPDDRFAVKVRATAPEGTPMPYLSLLFVAPDARPPKGQHVGQIWPDPAESVRELRRLRTDGAWRFLGRNQDLVDGTAPDRLLALYVDSEEDGAGPELFKLFATEEVVDFGVLADPRRQGSGSRLGRLLEAYVDNRPVSRSSDPNRSPAEWSVADAVVMVKERARPPIPLRR